METLQKDILNMKKEKMTLFVSTTAFRRNLLDLLGGFIYIYSSRFEVREGVIFKNTINLYL